MKDKHRCEAVSLGGSMFHSVRYSLVAVFFGLVLCAAMPVSAQIVASYSFADGTADGWTSFNCASTPTASSTVAYSGPSSSLQTTPSPAGAGGPSISLNSVLQAGAQYTITGWVKLSADESAGDANFTIKRSDPSCSGGP